MNTAVLTGRQVSQPLKIFIVSEAGKIADVTLHTSCHTNDDSALKVSCVNIYGHKYWNIYKTMGTQISSMHRYYFKNLSGLRTKM